MRRCWLFGAVNPETDEFLYLRLFPTRNTAITSMFLRELDEKHDIRNAEFFVGGAPWLQAGLFELGMHFRHETFGQRNPVKRVIQEIKCWTEQFYNYSGDADPETVENWLLAPAWAKITKLNAAGGVPSSVSNLLSLPRCPPNRPRELFNQRLRRLFYGCYVNR